MLVYQASFLNAGFISSSVPETSSWPEFKFLKNNFLKVVQQRIRIWTESLFTSGRRRVIWGESQTNYLCQVSAMSCHAHTMLRCTDTDIPVISDVETSSVSSGVDRKLTTRRYFLQKKQGLDFIRDKRDREGEKLDEQINHWKKETLELKCFIFNARKDPELG